MDGPGDYHTKWSKSDRKWQILYDIGYMWAVKKWCKCTYLQNWNTFTALEKELMITMGEGCGEG